MSETDFDDEKESATVLIVDDTPANLAVIVGHLGDFGYRVLVAQDGEEALTRAAFVRPDIILLDVMMPGIDGFTTCRRLKQDSRSADIPVIFMTALADTEHKLRGFQAGGVDYVTKPVQIEEVAARLDTHLTLRRMQRQLQQQNQLLEQAVAERTQELQSANSALQAEIHERRLAEAEVRRLNAELERRVIERTAQLDAANKELESFSYSVSHDLRAPLRSIDGFSQILLEDHAGQLDAQGQDYLKRLRHNSQRMGELIEDMLSLSHVARDSMRLGEVNLSDIAQQIVEDLRLRHPERQVEVTIQPQMLAQADRRLIRIALENLLGNAWKYTGKTAQAQIAFHALDEGGLLRYQIRDNGAGFDMRMRERLFTPFQRLHGTAEFEGSGVGLATVQRVIHRHGGKVDITGEVGKGCCVTFSLG